MMSSQNPWTHPLIYGDLWTTPKLWPLTVKTLDFKSIFAQNRKLLENNFPVTKDVVQI